MDLTPIQRTKLHQKLAKKDWKYPLGSDALGGILGCGYYRIYDTLKAHGLTRVENDAEFLFLLAHLQQRHGPFANLVAVFGPTTTIGELAALEKAAMASKFGLIVPEPEPEPAG